MELPSSLWPCSALENKTPDRLNRLLCLHERRRAFRILGNELRSTWKFYDHRPGLSWQAPCHDDPMAILRQYTVLDAADIEATATFWAGLYAGEVVRTEADWYWIRRGAGIDGGAAGPDHVPPQWPEGEQQVHLDFFVNDLASEHQRIMDLGAELLQQADELDAPTGFQVYADPAGHPFCLCWGWEEFLKQLHQPQG